MKKSINSVVSLVLGVVCCILLVVIGVLAATNFASSFMISLTYDPDIECKITLKINDGTAYTIYDNKNVVDIPTNVVLSEYVENGRLMINLGSIFEDMTLYSADTFYFEIYNYETFEISGACTPIARTGEIESYNSDPANSISYNSHKTITVQIEVLSETAITFNIDLIDD